MLVAPAAWYEFVPGVTDTGAFNQHFIRDIGIIQLFLGLAFGTGLFRPEGRIWLWTVATLWLSAHAIFHLWEVAVGICSPSDIVRDFPAVSLPAIVGAMLTLWAIHDAHARKGRARLKRGRCDGWRPARPHGRSAAHVNIDDIDASLRRAVALTGMPIAVPHAGLKNVVEVETAPFASRRQIGVALAFELVGQHPLPPVLEAQHVGTKLAALPAVDARDLLAAKGGRAEQQVGRA
jgi:hypothetical protein